MKTVSVYDPPMCCTTGVCGQSADSTLAKFAGDLEWLKSRGVTVRRYNLAQEPERFVQNSAVKAILDRSGSDELPAILVGETLVSHGRFPGRDELAEMADLDITDAAVEAADTHADTQDGDERNAASGGGCCDLSAARGS